MKQRFSSLDLQVVSHELAKTITGYRLSNIYDLTSRIFLFKFAKPESKHLLLVDSGFRCHLTSYNRAAATTPSSFVTKLRKHLRTRRVTCVRQLGTDRVLELTFSNGEYRLFFEFYAGGNVVLVGKAGTVLALLRIVNGGEDGANECKVGIQYQLEGRGVMEGSLKERIEAALTDGAGEDGAEAEIGKWKKKQKKKKKGGEGIKRLLAGKMSEFSPTLIEHCFGVVGVDINLNAEEVLGDPEKVAGIIRAFEEAARIVGEILEQVDSGDIKGFILAKQPSTNPATSKGATEKRRKKGVSFGSNEAIEDEQKEEKVQQEGEGKGLVFDDFHPFLPKQFENNSAVKILEHQGFNHTVDTFFSSIESQKLESRLKDRENAAIKRLESARTDHQRRVEGLRSLQEMNVRKAQAIEANLDRVEEVISSVNSLIAQGMDWVAMGRLIEQEQKRGNAVAELVKLPLRLYENIVTVKLSEAEYEEEGNDGTSASDTDSEYEEEEEGEEESTRQNPKRAETLEIDIDLSLSAWANSSSYHNEKKTAAVKESKTIQSSSRALKSTEKKIAADLKKGLKTEKQLLTPVRRQHWFEKFFFFISSDGYLVLAGRDLQQNEILYQRYFKRGDIYVNSDVEGASMVIVKNRPGLATMGIPPGTLGQAGVLSVSTSKAWERKSGDAAWWVEFEQVGKVVAKTGVFLGVGCFEITGAKRFLPPVVLILGYGVLWRIDDDSAKRRARLRVVAGGGDMTGGGSAGGKSVCDYVGRVKGEEDGGEGITRQVDAGEGEGQEEEGGEEEEQEEEQMEGGQEEEQEEQEQEEQEEGQEEQEEQEEEEAEGAEEAGGVEEAEDVEEAENLEEESSDEDFPDAKVNSAAEEDENEESETDEFPDTKVGRDESGQEPEIENRPKAEGMDIKLDLTSQATTTTGKKYLSAKERRELRKAKAMGSVAIPTASPIATNPNSQDATTKTKESVTRKQPQVRGKKAKQKRLATKYAHQDAEDRALALRLLGSASLKSKAIDPEEAKKLKAEEEAVRKARRREQHERAVREGVKAEEARWHELPEDEDEGAERVGLECFVGAFQAGDTVLEAIPVCAPWGAMGTSKLKVKIQPGAMKKGKAVKEVVQNWLRSKDVQGKERELLQGWRESEIINCVPVSKVKIFGAGSGGAGKGPGRGTSSKRGGKGSKRK